MILTLLNFFIFCYYRR